jgi:hypothetical protein
MYMEIEKKMKDIAHPCLIAPDVDMIIGCECKKAI